MKARPNRMLLQVALAAALWVSWFSQSGRGAQILVIGEHPALPTGSVRVPVKMPDATGLAATAFIVNFDPQLLTLTNVTTGGLGQAFSLEHKIEEGRVSVALVRGTALTGGSGTLVYLHFKVNAGAVPGMSAPLAIADRGASGQYGVDFSWTQSTSHSNGVVNVVSLTQDSDGDGLPDWWEDFYFEGPMSAGAASDPDGDGKTNLQEFIAGTNPLDAGSVLKVTELANGVGGFAISFPTILGKSYRIELSGDLAAWQTLAAGVAGTGGIVQIIDAGSGTQTKRFYRVVVE